MAGNVSVRDEMVEVTVQMLVDLQKKFPLPACIQPGMIREQLFVSHSSPSSLIINGVVYYLICISDPIVGRTIQWPIGTKSQAVFNQTIIKAITQISKEHDEFQLSCRTSLGSILRDPKGQKFNKFFFELARNALRITNFKHGLAAVSHISSDVEVDDRLQIMSHNVDKLNEILTQKENPVDQTQDQQLLDQLEEKKVDLKKRVDELMKMCPSKYREHMNANGPVQQDLLVTNQWQADLNQITNEQQLKNNQLEARNNWVETIKPIFREKLARENLLNDRNRPILIKTANENNIELFQGDSISVAGFMESGCIISEKLKTLIVNKDMLHLAKDFSVPLERSSRALSKITKEISHGEQDVKSLTEQCKESRKVYEAAVIAQGGHKFPLPDLDLEIRVDTPPAPYNPSHLIQSPGTESPKRILEEARQRRREAVDVAAGSDGSVNTPKSSGAANRSRNANSSMNQLTKSVLQKQTLSATVASYANSTVGDFQLPLSSSSPVPMHGNMQKAQTGPAVDSRSARSSLADILNELEESNLSFSDLSEESNVMNSTFDSPEPRMTQPLRSFVNEVLTGPSSRMGSRLPVPSTLRNGGAGNKKPYLPPSEMVGAVQTPDEPKPEELTVHTRRPFTAPAASPARRPRRSIQNIIDRFQRIKANRTNAEVGKAD